MVKPVPLKKPNPTKFKNSWRPLKAAFVKTAIFEGQEVEVMVDARGEIYFTNGRGEMRKLSKTEIEK